jgi:Ca-activated chloride channel family protein
MKRFACIALLVGLLFNSTFAIGALYARRALSSDAPKPLWLEKYDASVTITDQMAVTHVDQTFKNETANRLEGIFIFPLPDNAIVTELALWINGKRVVGNVMESDTARAKYQSVVQQSIDPALLEYLGNNLFKLSIFPIEALGNAMCERRIEITYAELLPYNSGNVEYCFLMKTINLTPKPVQRASCAFEWTSQKKTTSFTSPTHDNSSGLSIVKLSDYHYTGIVGNENTDSEKDFKLDCIFQNDAYALNNLTYTPRTDSLKMFFDSTGDNPYYVLWITPPDSAKPIKKNVVFVADISSSMGGTRIDQLKKSLTAMVNMLSPGDMFNIVAFSTTIQTFNATMVQAAMANKTAAIAFINQLTDMGLTDMEDALKTALKAEWDDTSANAIVFLTDGNPTWPLQTSVSRVIDTVKANNGKQISIFTFGIGSEPDSGFLKRLSIENNGFPTLIAADDSISAIMNSFMHKISYPLIKNSSLDYGSLTTSEVLPNPIPNLYAGTQLTVLGRYKNAGEPVITFKGVRGKDSLTLQQTLAFPAGTASHPFVPRMWASAKIDWILNQISMYGELKELVDQVKRLGKKYSIITPYTSMLVLEPTATMPIEDKTISLKLPQLLNSPNPISSFTTIRYCVPHMNAPQKVTLRIFNTRGCLVRTLVNDITLGGNFMVRWDVKNNFGTLVPAGMYFAILETSGGTRLMLSMKVLR